MNRYEVEQQLRHDHEKFLNSISNLAVPEDLLDKFKKAIMIVPPQAHGITFSKIKSILDKNPSELNISDINDIIKVVVNTPLQAFYDDLFDAVPEQIKLEKFMVRFNGNIQDFTENQKKKREMLEKLSDGVLKQTNGMRIIPNGKDY